MSRPRVAFFDFTGCEGCQLAVLNLESVLPDILELVDIVEFREAMDNKAEDYDIAFVEGSISTPSCVERIHDIRRRSRLLVALGSCASFGGLTALKNSRPAGEIRKEVYGADAYQFPTMPVLPLSAYVEVDFEVRGCPMSEREFIHLLKSLVLGRIPQRIDHAVCVECKLAEQVCVLEEGQFCLGPVTRAGCGALCPANGVSCTGCRGPVSNMNRNAALQMLEDGGFSRSEADKRLRLYASGIMNTECKI